LITVFSVIFKYPRLTSWFL